MTISKIHQTDVPNVNGVIYPRNIVEEAFKKAPNLLFVNFYEDMRKTDGCPNIGKAVGTIDKSTVDFNESGEVTAEVKILDTQKGRLVQDLIKDGVSVSFGLAGYGIVKDGVVDQFTLAGIGVDDSYETSPERS